MAGEISSSLIGDYGLAAFVVVVSAGLAWQGMALLRLFVQKKLNGRLQQHATECPLAGTLKPSWEEVAGDVADIAAAEDRIQLDIARGTFTCAWKRDEVTDLKHAIEANTAVLRELRTGIERTVEANTAVLRDLRAAFERSGR